MFKLATTTTFKMLQYSYKLPPETQNTPARHKYITESCRNTLLCLCRTEEDQRKKSLGNNVRLFASIENNVRLFECLNDAARYTTANRTLQDIGLNKQQMLSRPPR